MTEFNKNLARVRNTFTRNEMMLVAGLSMGIATTDPMSFADQINARVATSSGIVRKTIKRHKIDAGWVVTRLQRLTPAEMEVLLVQLFRWQCLDVREMMASNGLPSVCTLARMGLVEPAEGDIAWGWCCFRNGSTVYEFILHHPERMPQHENRTTYELAAELAWLIDASPSPLDDAMVLDCVYRTMKASGWRRCLVTIDDHGIKVAEVSIADLLHDRYEGTLEDGVVMAGVDAPDVFER